MPAEKHSDAGSGCPSCSEEYRITFWTCSTNTENTFFRTLRSVWLMSSWRLTVSPKENNSVSDTWPE